MNLPLARRLLLITGPPGSGKTTLIQRIYDHYTHIGVGVAGILTREYLAGRERVGFKLLDLDTREEGWLARKQGGTGPRMGRYNVESGDLERIGVTALINSARGGAPLVLVDEIGPMEMTSPTFRAALSELLATSKVVVATVRYGSHYPAVEEARKTAGTKTIQVTPATRESVPREIIAEIDTMLGPAGVEQQ